MWRILEDIVSQRLTRKMYFIFNGDKICMQVLEKFSIVVNIEVTMKIEIKLLL